MTAPAFDLAGKIVGLQAHEPNLEGRSPDYAQGFMASCDKAATLAAQQDAVANGLLSVAVEMLTAMKAYQMDVDDEPTRAHRLMMERAEAAIAAARPS